MVDFRIVAGLDTNNVTAGLGAIEKRFKNLTGTVTALAGSFGVAFGVRAILDQLDAYKNLQNRLKAVTDASVDLAEINNTLLGIANRSGASIAATTQIYSRLATSQKTLGISTAQLTDFTETLSKTIAISGATSYEAQGSLIQFSQAMASGALRGDELRAVMEQLPEVSNIIAKQFGVTTGQLAILGKQGKITSEQILIAFSKAAPEIEARFQKTSFTIANSFVILKNQILFALGALDKSSGFSQGFSKALIFAAKNIDVVIQAVKNLALFLGPSYLIKAIKTITVVVAANPIGLLLTAIAAIIAIVPEFQQELDALVATFQVWFKEITGVEASFGGLFSFLKDTLADVVLFFASSFESILGVINGLYNAATFLFDNLGTQPKVVGELMVYYLKKALQEYVKLLVSFYKTLAEIIFGIVDDILSALKNMVLAGTELLKGSLETAQTYADNATSALSRTANRVVNFGNTLKKNREVIDANKQFFPDIDKPSEAARNLGNLVAEQYAEGVSEFSGKITQAVKTAFYGEGFGVLTPAAQAGKAAADAFASSFRQQIGANNIGVGVLSPDVLDARAAERQRQEAFAPRGAMGLIPENFKSPGAAGAAGKAEEENKYVQELASLQQLILLEEQRIEFGNEAAEQLRFWMDLSEENVALTYEQGTELQRLRALQRDTEAVSAIVQELDTKRQLVEQERLLNLALQARPDLLEGINQKLAEGRINALEQSTALGDGITRSLEKLKLESENFAAAGEQAMNMFADKATAAITEFVQTGKFSFRDFALSVLDEITKIIVRLLVAKAISSFLGGGGAGADVVGGLAGGKAKGGTVQPDRSYIVGEQGPEIFQPRTTGSIIPNPASVQQAPPQMNVQVVNVDDPNAVPAAINKGGSDEAILNVLARNRDRVKQTIG